MSPPIEAVQIIESSAFLAQLNANSGTHVRDIMLGIIGLFTVVVLAFRALDAFANEHYGKMFTLIMACVPVIGIAYFPEVAVGILKGLFAAFTV